MFKWMMDLIKNAINDINDSLKRLVVLIARVTSRRRWRRFYLPINYKQAIFSILKWKMTVLLFIEHRAQNIIYQMYMLNMYLHFKHKICDLYLECIWVLYSDERWDSFFFFFNFAFWCGDCVHRSICFLLLKLSRKRGKKRRSIEVFNFHSTVS